MGIFKSMSALTKAECESVTKNCMKKADAKKLKEIDNMVNSLIKNKRSEVEQQRLL